MKYLSLLLLLSCTATPMTEEEREEAEFQRDYKYAMEVEKYIEREARCVRAGGIWVTTFSASNRRKPRLHELRTAGCVSSMNDIY